MTDAQNRRTQKTLYALLTVIMTAALIVAGVLIAMELVDMWRARTVREEVQELYYPEKSSWIDSWWLGAASAEEARTEGNENLEDALLPTELPPVQEDFAKLYERNPDVIGWLTAGEDLDLPVVQRDNEYYLSHNFFGEPDSNGTLFLNEMNVIYPRDKVLLIHGHNMRSKAMFGKLIAYEEEAYMRAHALLTFRSVYDEDAAYYVPVAGFHASMVPQEAGYFDVTPMNFVSDEEFNLYMDEAKKRSEWDAPVDVNAQDELLMLLTCSYHHVDGRFLLLCRRLRAGETPEQMETLYKADAPL